MKQGNRAEIAERHDAVIIGGGPAGMAAALELQRLGTEDVLLLERNGELGGILTQCIHPGFGLTYYREDLTGPEYARRLARDIRSRQLPVRTGHMVLDISHGPLTGGEEGLRLTVASRERGVEQIGARAVITATGCRERTRENLLIPGTRPAGIYTAGQAQDLINRRGFDLGRRVVIQGSGDIGLIMARRLAIEGYEVAAVLERLPYLSGLLRNKVQCLDHFGIPLLLGWQITRIDGSPRVTGAEAEELDEELSPAGGREYFEADTVLFSVGLIPELEVAKSAGAALRDGFHPEVDSAFQTGVPGLFVCGNALHINDLADSASREGEKAARSVRRFLTEPEEFERRRSSRLPYREPEPDTSLTAKYFRRLRREGKMVCIVCPKGCEVTAEEAGCDKGIEFFKRQSRRPGQRLATTAWSDLIRRERVPLVTRREVPVDRISGIKRLLTERSPVTAEKVTVETDEGPVDLYTPRADGPDASGDSREPETSEPREAPLGRGSAGGS
jgi:NADPH-dependent 2,4-dienoyl-CoA reductase/sulfur reductase-like enzyme/CxxC motif-containing protein